MRPREVGLAQKEARVVVIRNRKRILRRRILTGRGKVILLKKLSESTLKIGEAAKVRARVIIMRGLLLILMTSLWLNAWRGKGILYGDRIIKMLKRLKRSLTMLMMMSRCLNMMGVIMQVVG